MTEEGRREKIPEDVVEAAEKLLDYLLSKVSDEWVRFIIEIMEDPEAFYYPPDNTVYYVRIRPVGYHNICCPTQNIPICEMETIGRQQLPDDETIRLAALVAQFIADAYGKPEPVDPRCNEDP